MAISVILYYRNIRGIVFNMGHHIDQLSATRKTKKFEIELKIGKRIEEIMWKRRYKVWEEDMRP